MTQTTTIECDAIIFDLDGVLVDSAPVIERHWRQWSSKYGLDADRVISLGHGRRGAEIIAEMAPHLDANEEASRLEAAEGTDTEGIGPMDGADSLLRSLPVDRWAVATSGRKRTATTRLTHTGLPFPKVLITADDVTNGKPDPEPYLRAAEGLGIAPSTCVVFEDAPPGVAAAKAAGMRVIAITSTFSSEPLRQADAIIAGFAAIKVSLSADGYPNPITIEIHGEDAWD
jgi:sugar-phosphatase